MSLNSRIKKLEGGVVAPVMEDKEYPVPLDWVFETAFNAIRDSIEFDKLEHFLNSLAPDGASEEQEEEIVARLGERLGDFTEVQAQHHSNYDSPLVFPSNLAQAWLEDETLFMMSEDCEDCGYLYPSHREQDPRCKPGNYRSVPVYTKCLICGGVIGDDAWWKKNVNRKQSHLYSEYPYWHVWGRSDGGVRK
jgi:hypothetical protein